MVKKALLLFFMATLSIAYPNICYSQADITDNKNRMAEFINVDLELSDFLNLNTDSPEEITTQQWNNNKGVYEGVLMGLLFNAKLKDLQISNVVVDIFEGFPHKVCMQPISSEKADSLLRPDILRSYKEKSRVIFKYDNNGWLTEVIKDNVINNAHDTIRNIKFYYTREKNKLTIFCRQIRKNTLSHVTNDSIQIALDTNYNLNRYLVYSKHTLFNDKIPVEKMSGYNRSYGYDSLGRIKFRYDIDPISGKKSDSLFYAYHDTAINNNFFSKKITPYNWLIFEPAVKQRLENMPNLYTTTIQKFSKNFITEKIDSINWSYLIHNFKDKIIQYNWRTPTAIDGKKIQWSETFYYTTTSSLHMRRIQLSSYNLTSYIDTFPPYHTIIPFNLLDITINILQKSTSAETKNCSFEHFGVTSSGSGGTSTEFISSNEHAMLIKQLIEGTDVAKEWQACNTNIDNVVYNNNLPILVTNSINYQLLLFTYK